MQSQELPASAAYVLPYYLSHVCRFAGHADVWLKFSVVGCLRGTGLPERPLHPDLLSQLWGHVKGTPCFCSLSTSTSFLFVSFDEMSAYSEESRQND